jgi:hypothetical protein
MAESAEWPDLPVTEQFSYTGIAGHKKSSSGKSDELKYRNV